MGVVFIQGLIEFNRSYIFYDYFFHFCGFAFFIFGLCVFSRSFYGEVGAFKLGGCGDPFSFKKSKVIGFYRLSMCFLGGLF